MATRRTSSSVVSPRKALARPSGSMVFIPFSMAAPPDQTATPSLYDHLPELIVDLEEFKPTGINVEIERANSSKNSVGSRTGAVSLR